MSQHKFTNNLIDESSPYLLQHAHNPVQWHPWSDEALRKAKELDKPILLSIGYSACHWCHVMERESFENEQIAQLMNEYFINIKVDREERPDLDTIYMNAVQMMTGRGGWPMTVFLTPDQAPFFAGTYFPPEDRPGMAGFRRILSSVAQAYRERREAIDRDAATIAAELQKTSLSSLPRGPLNDEVLNAAASGLEATFDWREGGFGDAPKFPPAMSLSFLMRYTRKTAKPRILEMVETTLQAMAAGGIYDQLGGGFHRYSVDAHWLVPHFEKMLYDNALLSRAYLEGHLLTGKPLYRRIVEETLDYVLREMTSPLGGFYSTQDADSEGKEGKFFLWTPDEVLAIAGEEDGELFCRHYDVTAAGNFEGKNILHIPREESVTARLNDVSEERLRQALARTRTLLFEARESRVKPGRDEKMLAAWNGLMIRSFAEAAAALEREDYRTAAVRAAGFVLTNMMQDGRLLRSCKDGAARLRGYLEDYSCMIDALLSLYEATCDHRWMNEAIRLAYVLCERFWDAKHGSFYFTADDHEPLLQRPRDLYDNATPSGNSVAAWALLRLWKFTGDENWLRYPKKILEGHAGAMSRYPSAFGNYLCALDFYLSEPLEIAIIGEPAAAEAQDLLREAFRRYLPNKVVACGAGELPLLQGRPQLGGRPTAYVCRNHVCSAPVTNPQELAAELDAGGTTGTPGV